MYAPKQFREERREVLVEAIGSIRFASLVAWVDGFEAVHLPMIAREHDGALALEGHVARGNPLWKAIGTGAPGLAIFQGPQAYVHPGWLATKRETGRAVPTWNYVAVQARGELSAIEDPAWLLRHVDDLTELIEQGRPEPWSTADAPEGYIETLARGIVGLRLDVREREGAWKLIQHHPEANRLGVIDGLSASEQPGDRALADEMRQAEHFRQLDRAKEG